MSSKRQVPSAPTVAPPATVATRPSSSVATAPILEAPAPISRPVCNDTEACRHAGFVLERLRMLKLPSNRAIITRLPDNTFAIIL